MDDQQQGFPPPPRWSGRRHAASDGHRFDTPKFALVFGAFGAAGFGASLMSPSLFWVGAAIMYGAFIVTLVRYLPEFRTITPGGLPVYRAMELLVVLFCLLCETLIPSWLIQQRVFSKHEMTSEARLDFAGVTSTILADGGGKFHMTLHSTGTQPAVSVAISPQPVISATALSIKDIDNWFSIATHRNLALPVLKEGSELPLNQNVESRDATVAASVDQWKLFKEGKAWLYWMAVASYTSDDLPEGYRKIGEFCYILTISDLQGYYPCNGTHNRTYILYQKPKGG